MPAWAHSRTGACMHVCTHAHAYAHVRSPARARARARTPARPPARPHACTHARTHDWATALSAMSRSTKTQAAAPRLVDSTFMQGSAHCCVPSEPTDCAPLSKHAFLQPAGSALSHSLLCLACAVWKSRHTIGRFALRVESKYSKTVKWKQKRSHLLVGSAAVSSSGAWKLKAP